MDLAPIQQSLLDQYLSVFDPLIGDRRTERTFRGTVQGIIGAESLICSRIAAFSPSSLDRWPQWAAAGEADG
jgi:hypothetical protein